MRKWRRKKSTFFQLMLWSSFLVHKKFKLSWIQICNCCSHTNFSYENTILQTWSKMPFLAVFNCFWRAMFPEKMKLREKQLHIWNQLSLKFLHTKNELYFLLQFLYFFLSFFSTYSELSFECISNTCYLELSLSQTI